MTSRALADLARHRRRDLGLTQADLADLAGVSERLIRDLEKGRLTIRTDKLIDVLSALGLELEIQRARTGR